MNTNNSIVAYFDNAKNLVLALEGDMKSKTYYFDTCRLLVSYGRKAIPSRWSSGGSAR